MNGGKYSSLVLKEEKSRAHKLLLQFSKLLRSSLIRSDQISISIFEELEIVRNYLDLEKLRLSNKFNYDISNDSLNIETILIPKGLILGFVENSVKHGVFHLQHEGFIKVKFSKQGHNLTIQIDDNGIGRSQSKKYHIDGTGKGLDIMNKMVRLYNKLNNTRISFEINDKIDQGQPIGTKVIIKLN